jgi:hypothetical protein
MNIVFRMFLLGITCIFSLQADESGPEGEDSAQECGYSDTLHYHWQSSPRRTEELYYQEGPLDVDWPGKREDPFYDTLTR